MVGQVIRAQRESRRMNPPGAYLLLLFLGYRCGWALTFRSRDGWSRAWKHLVRTSSWSAVSDQTPHAQGGCADPVERLGNASTVPW